jgi:hypothetical protein
MLDMDSGGAVTSFLKNKFMPRPSMPSMPSIPGMRMPSLKMPYLGKQSASTSISKSNNLFSASLFEYGLLGVLTLFIGIFFSYIFAKDKDLGFDALDKGIIVAALVLIGIGGSYIFKANIIDFLISSQINIICIYLLISYVGINTFSGPDSWVSFLRFFRTLSNIITDPTTIFKTGYTLIVPIILLVIPLLVLLYNFTKNIYMTILVLGVSAGIVYSLYPKNNAVPIVGGSPLGTAGGPTCVEHWYDNFNPKYWGLPSC